MFKQTLAYLLLLVTCFACTKNAQNSQIPSNFTVTIRTTGGMMPLSRTLFISESKCYELSEEYETKKQVDFTLSKETLNEIYGLFQQYKFEEIKMREEMIFDRGGSTITLTYNNTKTKAIEKVEKINAGSYFIEGEDLKRYEALIEAIKKKVKPSLEAKKTSVKVILDSSLMNPSYGISMQINQDLNYHSNINEPQKSFDLFFAEGTQVIRVNVYGEREDSSKPRPTIASEVLNVETNSSTKEITIQLRDGKLTALVK